MAWCAGDGAAVGQRIFPLAAAVRARRQWIGKDHAGLLVLAIDQTSEKSGDGLDARCYVGGPGASPMVLTVRWHERVRRTDHQKVEVTELLARLGSPHAKRSYATIRLAHCALIPADSARIVGLGSLPGAMSDPSLAGVDPLTAIHTVVVMVPHRGSCD